MIVINLSSKRHVVCPVDTLMIPIEDAVMSFTSDTFALGQLIADINGKQTAVKKDKTLDLSPYMKEGTVLEIRVSLVVSGHVAMVWNITPITVRTVDAGYELLPEIVALRERCTALEKRTDRCEKALLELKTIYKGE